MAIITLTTDFGTRDGYVGAMKGVLARRAPGVQLVDLAHDVPRHDIAHGAWVLATAALEFPRGTIHLAVVDPGVGTARRGVIARASGQFFVGPDNGLFGYLDIERAWAIAASRESSPTFHGRDVFAPAAASLARGHDPDTWALGQPVALVGQLPWGTRPAGEGRVIHVDHYGNLITDLPGEEAGEAVAIAGRRLPLARTYEDVAAGELLAYVGSMGTVEVAVREGRADGVLDAPRGTRIVPVAPGGEYR
ncbi:MAG TPA: SAM-dependent chlorinase/fluorinase [Kofleriaceae bacterium]|nr:SAM-dependent chlorinase/fluorinase [Kofleriaceae bacterium]